MVNQIRILNFMLFTQKHTTFLIEFCHFLLLQRFSYFLQHVFFTHRDKFLNTSVLYREV